MEVDDNHVCRPLTKYPIPSSRGSDLSLFQHRPVFLHDKEKFFALVG